MLLLNASTGLSSLDVIYIFLSISGIVITIISSIVIYWLTTQRGIAYDVISPIETGIQGEYTMQIKLWNSGRSGITQDHYGEPIIFNFGPNATVEEARVADTRPDIIRTSVKVSKLAGKVTIGQKIVTTNREDVIGIPMLNKQDYIVLYLKVGSFTGVKKVDFHIANIKNFVETPNNLGTIIKVAFYSTVGLCICFLICNILWGISGRGVLNQPYDLLLLMLIWVVLLSYSFRFKRKHLLALGRTLPWIACVIAAYIIIHFSIIAYLPSFLSLGSIH